MSYYSDALTTEQNAAVDEAIKAAVDKERAACAKIARAEAEHCNAVGASLANRGAVQHLRNEQEARALSAERVARAIERGER